MSIVSTKVFNRLWNTVQNAIGKVERGFPIACFMDTNKFVPSRPKICGGSVHAEVNLIESFTSKMSPKNHLKRKDIFVFKLSKSSDVLMNAKPCLTCIKHMQNTNTVNKIYYSSGTEDIFLWENIANIMNRPSTYFLFLEAYNNTPVSTKIHHSSRYVSCHVEGLKLTGELRRTFNITVFNKKTNYN